MTSRIELFLRLVAGVTLQPLGAAAERGDRALAHLVGAERGDEGQPAALLRRRRCARGLGAAAGRAAPPAPRRTVRGASSSSASSAGRAPSGRPCGRPRLRRTASWLPARPCAWPLPRGDGVRPRRACAPRRLRARRCSMTSRSGAAAGLLFGDLALFGFAHARVGERMRARTALFLGQRAQHDAGRLRRSGGRGRGGRRRGGCAAVRRRRARFGATRRGAAASAFASAAPMTRRLTFSTTTCLLRPWLKLWRTTPCSTPRLQRQRLVGDAQLLVARCSSSQLIPIPVLRAAVSGAPLSASGLFRLAGPKALMRACARESASLAGPASRAACTTFDRPNAKSNCARGERLGSTVIRRFRRPIAAQGGIELAHAVGRTVARHAGGRRSCSRAIAASTLAKPAATCPGLAGDRERIERRALEQPVGQCRRDRRQPGRRA